MESGFGWTPYNQHLPLQKAMSRWVGRQPKNFQIRYKELRRQLQQAEAIVDEPVTHVAIRSFEHVKLALDNPVSKEDFRMFVSKVAGPFVKRTDAEREMRVHIRVLETRDNAAKEAFEKANPGREWVPFSPKPEDCYRIEDNKGGFIVVLDDPSL